MSVHFTTVGLDDAWKNDEITACFQKYTRLILWPKGKVLDLEYFVWARHLSDFPQSGRKPFQPIEDVSNLTTTKFFEAFSDSSGQICLNLLTANLDR